jgi:hypothetical protein
MQERARPNPAMRWRRRSERLRSGRRVTEPSSAFRRKMAVQASCRSEVRRRDSQQTDILQSSMRLNFPSVVSEFDCFAW